MKKIAIVMLSALVLTLCACSNQPDNNKEGTSASEVSSALGSEAASNPEKTSEGTSKNASSSSTLPSAESDGSTVYAVPFDDGNVSQETSAANNKKQDASQGSDANKKDNKETTTEAVSQGSEGFELPRIPVN